MGERLDKAGADLVSLSEKIDTTSAAGKMVFRLMAVMAEFERDLQREETRFLEADLVGWRETPGDPVRIHAQEDRRTIPGQV